jgi:uncharacterized membrane protein YeiH
VVAAAVAAVVMTYCCVPPPTVKMSPTLTVPDAVALMMFSVESQPPETVEAM